MALNPQRAEPLPPAGLNAGKLHDVIVAGVETILPGAGEPFFEWMAIDHPLWGRQNAQDAEALKTWCAQNSGKPAN